MLTSLTGRRLVVLVPLAITALLAGCPPGGPGTDSGLPMGSDGATGEPACDDGRDNDGDGRVDFPIEPGCLSAMDDDETDPEPPPVCANGLDDDGDGAIDYGYGGLGGDPGCTFAADDDETDVPECQNGIDDDMDMLVDYPEDPGCSSDDDVTEYQQECKDGVDNDGDMLIDFPDDPDCDDPLDPVEQAPPVCNNGLDDDGDGLTDYPADPGCENGLDEDEFNPADCEGLQVEDLAGGSADGTTMMGAASVFSSGCGGDMAPEGLAYLNVPAGLDLIELNTFGSDHPTVLSLLPACSAMTTEVACSTDPSNAYLEIDDLPAGEYWVVVDGESSGDVGFWRVGFIGIIAPAQPCTPGDTHFLCDLAAGYDCIEVTPGAGEICTAGTCSDAIDNDMDGIVDWPLDPGCLDPADADEADPAMVPACYDGVDNDMDLLIDYPADPGCSATSDIEELDECIPGVQVESLGAGGTAMGSIGAGTSNFNGSCNSGGFLPSSEVVYALNVPALANVHVSTNNPGTTADTVLYVRETCDDGGTELGCASNGSPGDTLTLPAVMPGSYFIFVDGADGGVTGAFEVTATGDVLIGQPCDPMDLQWQCIVGSLCTDPGTGYECTPTECNDGTDNDGDSLVDYPLEPGCDSIADDDETDPPTPPECADGMDNDGDALIDYGMDFGCTSAADDDEAGCYFALISQETQFSDNTTITGLLSTNGHAFDIFDNNGTTGVHTSDMTLLNMYNTIIFHEHDRTLGVTEMTNLQTWVDNGGRLLVTGYDSLGSPTDANMAAVVNCTGPGDGPFSGALSVVNDTHAIMIGPAQAFAVGTALTAGSTDHDQCTPGAGAVQLVTVSSSSKLLVTDNVGPGNGRVVYWNGNGSGSGPLVDWLGAAGSQPDLQNLFVNVIEHLCSP